jgi:hypothetical protein
MSFGTEGIADMTYERMLKLAYTTYARFRSYREWAMSHCNDADAQTRKHINEQYAIMYANVEGQTELIARMFVGRNIDAHKVHEDLQAMYEEKHNKED